jgi:tRNA threonylcarbamoyladenosine biosynthesis protein TsaE
MTELFHIKHLDELNQAAQDLLTKFPTTRVFALRGQMGAGKTTFIKLLCKHIGVKNNVNSPTFAVINEYVSESGFPVYHFDMYRLKQMHDAIAIGCVDYFESGQYCFIEWPEIIESLLPTDSLVLEIQVDETTGTRSIYLP